ncbi:MAG TPA: hypothetical protein VN947_15135, partial [Polyangia bacterium]|nr:hypothetical protein [Polyangia bacterium]
MINELAAARRLLCSAGMLKMSIRRKLFLAFSLVAAISSATLLLVAASYVRTVRAQLDRQFLEDARSTLERDRSYRASLDQEALDFIQSGALDPGLFASFLAGDSQTQTMFERVPALLQIALYDRHTATPLRVWTRPGSSVARMQLKDIEALMYGPGARVSVGVYPVGHNFLVKNGRYFAMSNASTELAPRGMIVGELDTNM